MNALIAYPERLDPDSPFYRQTPEQIAAWWAEYMVQEIARYAAARAAHDAIPTAPQDVWEVMQNDKTPLYIHIGEKT